MSDEHPVEVTDKQVAHVTNAIDRWIHIKKTNGQAWHSNFKVDLDHSSLFRRLLAGLPIYKFPPPVSMSYPWYGLLDDKGAKNVNLHPRLIGFTGFDGPVIIVEQSIWLLEETVQEGQEYIIRWPKYKLRIRCVKQPISPNPMWRGFDWDVSILENENEPVDTYWKVEKLPS